MPSYTVERSLTLTHAPQAALASITDFAQFRAWNPWSVCDPSHSYEISSPSSGEGAWYSWTSPLMGQGRMHTLRVQENAAEGGFYIAQEIEFVTPMRAQASVYWSLRPEQGGTRATWGMTGRLPFLLGFLKPRMEAYIAADYEHGLLRLAQHMDASSYAPSITIRGAQEYEGFAYAAHALEKRTPIRTQPWAAMHQELSRVAAEQCGISEPSFFTVIQTFDPRTARASGCFGVKLPAGAHKKAEEKAAAKTMRTVVWGRVAGGLYHRVDFYGHMDDLRHAWNAAMMSHKHRDKTRPYFEDYSSEGMLDEHKNGTDATRHAVRIFIPVTQIAPV